MLLKRRHYFITIFFIKNYIFRYIVFTFSRVIMFFQSLPKAFSHNGSKLKATLIIVSICSSERLEQIPLGISIWCFLTICLKIATPSG